MPRRLRSGYTTGACAAAAAKAAVVYGLAASCNGKVEIPFPDGSRHGFNIHRFGQQETGPGDACFFASVIKDAGDDPDVTNGAEIIAAVRFIADKMEKSQNCVLGPHAQIRLCRGEGVGWVSKAGLAVNPGEPAINPVPRMMICNAVNEGLTGKPARPNQIWPRSRKHNMQRIERQRAGATQGVEVTISIPDGEILAKKTLNSRLGIIGGLSILGTTGIVKPVSAESWTATIKASLNVARVAGLKEVVLSTGRTSEKGVQQLLDLPEEAYAMMGDYLHFSLQEAAAAGFKKIHLAAMWAKIMKAAMEIPQTHVRHGALEVENALKLLESLDAAENILEDLGDANTAREIFVRLNAKGEEDLIRSVCRKAKKYGERISGSQVDVYLVNSNSKVLIHV